MTDPPPTIGSLLPTDYDYDVFISYRRGGGARRWVERHFAPTLADCLEFELDHEPRVFFDQKLEVGTTWPADLGHQLAKSRMLISLWSKNYLQSDWCALELSHMLARETDLGFRTADNPKGLIAICVIHDGERLPGDLGAIQSFGIREFFNTRMREDSQMATDLETALRAHAPTLAGIIELAPPFRPDWPARAAKDFYHAYKDRTMPSQDAPPTFTSR